MLLENFAHNSLFSNEVIFMKRKTNSFGKKRGGKENFYLLHTIFLLKNFFFKIPLWDHVDTQFLFNQIPVALFILCLERGFHSALTDFYTGEFNIRVLGCDFFCKLNPWLHNQQCLLSQKRECGEGGVRREAL